MTACPSPPARGAARIYLRQVGSETGVVAELPSAWNELVRLAETKLGFVPLRFFLATGDQLDEDGLDLVRSNEIIYVSGGNAAQPARAATPNRDRAREFVSPPTARAWHVVHVAGERPKQTQLQDAPRRHPARGRHSAEGGRET